MLVRDFIEDSLYNPHYGYFSKQAVIFSTAKPFDFTSIPNSNAFEAEVARRYAEYGVPTKAGDGPGRQLWHTPTELFKPWYGRAIAQCLVSEYLLKFFPYEDLIIYEMGAGNGTLATNILDFIREEYPEVYDRTRYRIIEISANLANIQRDALASHSCVEVVNKSVFEWDTYVPAPCFFLALEVIDNFAHDLIRYDMETLQPYQAVIAVDADGEFDELYEPVHDNLIRRFLEYRRRIRHPSPAIPRLLESPTIRSIRNAIPFASNMSKAEYIPTKLLTFLETLRDKFPLHRLLLSDFSSLPDSIPGHNAPVVQTRYMDTMVPCTTLLVQQGYFDIFFPTSFELLRDMYELVMSRPMAKVIEGSRPSPLSTSASPMTLGANFFSAHGRRSPLEGVTSSSGLLVGQRKSSVFSHREFLEKYAALEQTTLRNGDNPILTFYQNVKFLF